MADSLPPRSLASLGLAWLALMALATVSLLSPAVLAIPIAVAKALIVAFAFMHVARGPERNALAIAVGVAMFVLLVLGVAADVEYR